MEVVAHIIKYNSQSAGRDKLSRLFQYVSKYAGWYATQHDRKDLIAKFKSLENSLSGSRKVLRLGKSIDMIQGALRSTKVPDQVVRICLVLSKLHQAFYLLVDNFVWASKIGLIDTDTKRLTRVASRFWLVSLICNLVRNFYDILTDLKLREDKKTDGGGSGGAISRYSREEYDRRVSPLARLLSHRPLVVDTAKNLADLPLPLTNLGYLDVPTQYQALLGVFSSVLGILVVWNPALKLTP